jgi:hypothetical protein
VVPPLGDDDDDFSFFLIQKKQKIKHGYFYTKNWRTYFPITTLVALAAHSILGSLLAANAKIHTVIL